jgi:Fe-S oxidoreductase
MEFPEARMDLQRADEANETGAEVLATACPICLQMLDNGIKAREYPIEVKDIGLIVKECLNNK